MYADLLAALRHFYRITFWTAPRAYTRQREGYALSFSGYRHLSGANQLWVDDPACFDAAVLDDAVRFFRPHRAEWTLMAVPPAQEQLVEKAKAQGGFFRWSNPLMFRAAAVPQGVDLPYQIRIQQIVADDYLPLDYAHHIMAEAFHMELETSRQMLRGGQISSAQLQHWIAYHNGHPASIATVNMTNRVAGIWNVGTRRMFRRRGIAKALMQHIIGRTDAAGLGCMLLASPQGRPMYEALGFQRLTDAHYIGFPAV